VEGGGGGTSCLLKKIVKSLGNKNTSLGTPQQKQGVSLRFCFYCIIVFSAPQKFIIDIHLWMVHFHVSGQKIHENVISAGSAFNETPVSAVQRVAFAGLL
jgi:hypothetical protein